MKIFQLIFASSLLYGCFSTEPDFWGSERRLSLTGIEGEYIHYATSIPGEQIYVQARSPIKNMDDFNKISQVPQYPKFDFVLWENGMFKLVFEESYLDEVEQSEWIHGDTLDCFPSENQTFRCPFKMIGAHADSLILEKGRTFAKLSVNYLFKVEGNGGYIYFYSRKPDVATDTAIKAWTWSDTHLFSGTLTYK